MTPRVFNSFIWRFYRAHGRHNLPWRKTNEVYPLLVSEIMLQQTQVERVIPFYQSFMKQFPTAKKLAKSPLSRVLKAWQGLGYNRRAKMLHMAAAELLTRDIQSVSDLETLPGVGPYTARAVAAFAFNQETIVIETNIRTVIIHHFFSGKHKVSDREIGDVLGTLLPKGRAREWYSALMDYGAHLKHSGISHTVRSTTHVKQSKFTGSLREARGAIVKKLAQDGPTSSTDLSNLLGSSRRTQMRGALRALCLEKLIQKDIKNYRLPGE